jgi:lipopolysaccharide/colanic/teichoic acid biosynthesis glycosyltransferase
MKNLIKFLFDRFFGLLGFVFLLPFMIIISLIILIVDGYPALFIQKRVGYNGKLFSMVKFRTMKHTNIKSTVSVKGDSRITKLGAFLRRYKLDELPELWNVLVGQMSFVGPRPDVPGYADKLEDEDRNILKLRPGITGPATLKYSNEEALLALVENPIEYNDTVLFPDKVKINLEYYYNHNLLIDIKIILSTLFRVRNK